MKAFFGSSLIALAVVKATELPILKEWEMLDLLNEIRAEGVTCPDGEVFPPNPVPLEWDCRLFDAANFHSQEMAETGRFLHYGVNGDTPTQRAHAFGAQVGGVYENLAAGNLINRMTIDQWVTSETNHCNNMMSPDRKSVGVGYFFNGEDHYRHYWTMKLNNVAPRESDKDCYLTPAPTSPPVPTVEPTPFPTFENGKVIDPEAYHVFEQMNVGRSQGTTCPSGDTVHPAMPKMQWNCALMRAAQRHADDMAANAFLKHTGSDGSDAGDRAEEEGVNFSCEQFIMLKGTGAEAWESFNNISCDYYLGNSEYKSFAVARGYNPDYPKYFWVFMMSKYEAKPEHCDCYTADMFEDGVTPNPTTAPTSQPTAPTAEPTLAPTDAPTNSPTESPTEVPTPAPTYVECKDLTDEDACKAETECAWKNKCKSKADLCPGLNSNNCSRFGCNHIFGVCGWREVNLC